jgi:hypothetical protein
MAIPHLVTIAVTINKYCGYHYSNEDENNEGKSSRRGS